MFEPGGDVVMFVGAVVVRDEMDVEVVGDSTTTLESLQESQGGPVSEVAVNDPRCVRSRRNRGVSNGLCKGLGHDLIGVHTDGNRY